MIFPGRDFLLPSQGAKTPVSKWFLWITVERCWVMFRKSYTHIQKCNGEDSSLFPFHISPTTKLGIHHSCYSLSIRILKWVLDYPQSWLAFFWRFTKKKKALKWDLATESSLTHSGFQKWGNFLPDCCIGKIKVDMLC